MFDFTIIHVILNILPSYWGTSSNNHFTIPYQSYETRNEKLSEKWAPKQNWLHQSLHQSHDSFQWCFKPCSKHLSHYLFCCCLMQCISNKRWIGWMEGKTKMTPESESNLKPIQFRLHKTIYTAQPTVPQWHIASKFYINIKKINKTSNCAYTTQGWLCVAF